MRRIKLISFKLCGTQTSNFERERPNSISSTSQLFLVLLCMQWFPSSTFILSSASIGRPERGASFKSKLSEKISKTNSDIGVHLTYLLHKRCTIFSSFALHFYPYGNQKAKYGENSHFDLPFLTQCKKGQPDRSKHNNVLNDI